MSNRIPGATTRLSYSSPCHMPAWTRRTRTERLARIAYKEPLEVALTRQIAWELANPHYG